MEAIAYIVPGQFAYLSIPSTQLRHFVDDLFPFFAKFPLADSLACGGGHRYRAGHDLLLDLPSTFSNHGVTMGYQHAGHVLLTDFPTKAGIPIPGFSQGGLGQWLQSIGISQGWLNVNACDAGVGLIAIAEGGADLMQALGGTLDMHVWTFFDTLVEGGIEILLACHLENPLLLVGGIENVLAGMVSAWKTFSVYVDPQSFFGASLTSALIGLMVGYGIAGQSPSAALMTALRSGVIGGLFSVSAGFGFGAIGGLLAFIAGQALARRQQLEEDKLLMVDRQSLQFLLAEIKRGPSDTTDLLHSMKHLLLSIEVSNLPIDPKTTLEQSCLRLHGDPVGLVTYPRTLRTDKKAITLKIGSRTLL
jgi:hypothetical protein